MSTYGDWTVCGDLRHTDWDNHNNDAPEAIGPMEGITYDPELSCFFAYANRAVEALALIEALEAKYGVRLSLRNRAEE